MYATHPRRAFAAELQEWGRYMAGRRMERLGFTNHYLRGKLPSKSIVPDWADLWNIYKLIRERKPRVIVELGGGCSTIMIGQALHENATKDGAEGKLYSLDMSEFWLSQTRSYLPEFMEPYCELSVGEVEAVDMEGDRVTVVKNFPRTDINFLYVDGGLVPGIHIGADAVVLEEAAPPDYSILIDGRVATVNFIRSYLKRKYRDQSNAIHHWTFLESTEGVNGT